MNYSNYRCVACNVHFNNFDEQKQHYFTYHSRTVDQGQFTKTIYSSYSQLPATNKKVVPMKCDICNISCSSQSAYDFHVRGKKHSKTLNRIALTKTDSLLNNDLVANDISSVVPVIQQSQILYKPNLMCDVCQVNCLQLDQLQKHLDGARHQRKMKSNRFAELKSKKDPSVYCEFCDIFMMEEVMEKHRESGKHKRKNSDKTTAEPAEKKPLRVQVKSPDIPTSVEHCGFCHIALKSPADAVEHYQTPKHALNVINRTKNYDLWCDLCQISFVDQQFQDLHMKGFRHYVRANRGNKSPEGAFRDRLLKMREKIKGLHQNKRNKAAFSYTDKYKFVANESAVVVKADTEIVDTDSALVIMDKEPMSTDAEPMSMDAEPMSMDAEPISTDTVSVSTAAVPVPAAETTTATTPGKPKKLILAPVAHPRHIWATGSK